MRGIQFDALHRPIEARRHDATSASCDACTRAKLSRAASGEAADIDMDVSPRRRKRRCNRRPAAGFRDVAHRCRRGFADSVQQRCEPFARSLHRTTPRNRDSEWRSVAIARSVVRLFVLEITDPSASLLALLDCFSRFGLSKSFQRSPVTTSHWKAGSRCICRCFCSHSGFRWSLDSSWEFTLVRKVRAAIWLKV